jgi:hypothetical protein
MVSKKEQLETELIHHLAEYLTSGEMDGLIHSHDQDLIWIGKNNLKKKRLLSRFPDEVMARSRVE